MQIITYTNSAEVMRIDKSSYLSNRVEMSIPDRILGGQNIQAPVLRISSPTTPTFNYVHIPTFNRYYFASTPVWVAANEWEIALICDVLYSHKNKILNLHGIASRLEDQGKHSMIIDDRITAEATQYADIEFYEMGVVEGYTRFDMQTDSSAKRTVFSCFSGSEATATGGGPSTMSMTKDGVKYNFAPSFDRDYQSEDGAYQANGAGTYSITIRGTAMQAPSAWGIDGLQVSGSNSVVTVSNIKVTQSCNVYVQIITPSGGYIYRIQFTV